jgi:membrane protease YdiL (CAAX protease family)
MPWDIWLIFMVLGVVVPWRGRVRLRAILAKPRVEPSERIALYVSTIAFQWVAAGVAAWRAWARGFTASQLGLVLNDRWQIVAAALLGAGVLATLQWFNLRRMGRVKTKAPAALRVLAERILPQSLMESFPFFSLAVTAGLCEEFLYRGFALAAFTRAGLPTWTAVCVSSILFGLAHLYQGRGGLVRTVILGIFFGIARIAYDSLVPVIAWHIAVDVAAGVAGPRYLTDTKSVSAEIAP